MYNKLYKLAILILGLFTPLAAMGVENNLPDPTEPAPYSEKISSEVPNGDIIITAIFVGKDRKVAIIGNHPFTIGEKISGLTIVAIDTNGITLKNKDGVEARVTMSCPTIKLPITNNKKGNRENLD